MKNIIKVLTFVKTFHIHNKRHLINYLCVFILCSYTELNTIRFFVIDLKIPTISIVVS